MEPSSTTLGHPVSTTPAWLLLGWSSLPFHSQGQVGLPPRRLQVRGPAEGGGEMGRRASPSPSRGRRTRGAAFQRSGGGGLTEGDTETPSRETPKEGAKRHGGTEIQGQGTRRPGEGTRRPGEKKSILGERTQTLGGKSDPQLDTRGPQEMRSGGSGRHRQTETPRETEKGAETKTRAQRLGTGHARTGRDRAGRREATE